MNSQLLKYIAHLSKQDTKTLSQKGLKACEELGELAKQILPYDNAFATTHRLPNRIKVLEESCDVILTALSIAYDLDFTDDEIEQMMTEKSEKWAGLQAKEANLKYPLPFEIHITVDLSKGPRGSSEAPVHWFKVDCQAIGVKPIVLDLQDKTGASVMTDVMTSSKHFGTNTTALVEIERITREFDHMGYTVVRKKLETVPWHPAAPQQLGDVMPKDCYFEAHLPVTLPEDQISILRSHVKNLEFNVHASQNTFKKLEDGLVVVMLTYRTYDRTAGHFDFMVNYIKKKLSVWNIGKVHTEFAIYDTKISHDASWLKD